MVKNTFGGNKHKSQGRKFVNAKPSSKLRLAECDGELYAVVTKMCGTGMFHAQCIDGELRLGHIRGKFSGRKKRDNMVTPGIWVLVGERNFSNLQENSTSHSSLLTSQKTKKDKLEQCDLLEVYSDSDKQTLKDTVSMNWSMLNYDNGSNAVKDESKDEMVVFENENDAEINNLLQNMDTSIKITMNEKSGNTNATEESWIDINDI